MSGIATSSAARSTRSIPSSRTMLSSVSTSSFAVLAVELVDVALIARLRPTAGGERERFAFSTVLRSRIPPRATTKMRAWCVSVTPPRSASLVEQPRERIEMRPAADDELVSNRALSSTARRHPPRRTRTPRDRAPMVGVPTRATAHPLASVSYAARAGVRSRRARTLAQPSRTVGAQCGRPVLSGRVST